MSGIALASNFDILADRAAGQRVGIIGKSGSGKTNTQRVFAVGWHAHVGSFTIVDPMAQFLDLRALKNTIVAGGRSADVPLTLKNASQLARSSIHEHISIVLDTSELPRPDEMEVVAAYLETMWETVRLGMEHIPYALLIDEAKIFAPQSDTPPTREIIADIAKRGRHRGLTSVMATQRPARLDKNFLTQTSILIAHRLFSVDAKPLTEQIPMSEKELRAMLSRLATGEALIVADPVFIGDQDFVRVQVNLSQEFTPLPDRVAPIVREPRTPDSDIVHVLPADPAPPEGVTAPERDNAQLQKDKAELLETNQRLHSELAALRDQLAKAAQVTAAQMPLMSALDTPVTVKAEENHTGVTVTQRVVERTVETTFKADASSRAVKIRMNAQQKRLKILLARLATMKRTQRHILSIMLAEPTITYQGNALATVLDLQPRTYHDALRHIVEDRDFYGLVTRQWQKRDYDCFCYRVDIDWFTREFPNLDSATVVHAFVQALH